MMHVLFLLKENILSFPCKASPKAAQVIKHENLLIFLVANRHY
jgi:hypothetical protein